jgi:hypothetical protein
VVTDAGPWRGPDTATWVERIARYLLREGETLPLVKPFPAAPAEEEIAGAAQPWSEGELREAFGK